MPIRVLPPEVAAGIAAGEVIERPASVVKELVDNALDAGARSIAVELEQGGLARIRVSDDGSGIPPDELPLAFTRHATSKIASLTDLDALSTMGFRGEALASIAATARVRLSSRPADASGAAYLEMAGVSAGASGTEPAAPGTTVTVESLFASIPARLKFLRSVPAETSRVRAVVQRAAMAFPSVRLRLRADGRTLCESSGNGELRDVMAEVFDPRTAAALLAVAPSPRAPYAAHGFVSPPSMSRANRTGMHLFVNGRAISSRTLSVAVEEAYRGLLMEGRYPLAVLFLQVPPAEVDVNVHPNKREVRFVRDADAFSSVQRAVRETLVASEPVPEAPMLLSATAAAAPAPGSMFMSGLTVPGASGPLPEPGPVGIAERAVVYAPAQPSQQAGLPPLRVLGQVAGAYIAAEGPDGLYLIDQHAAHESVLYYRLLAAWVGGQGPAVQPLLEPLPLELSPQEQEAAEDAREELGRYGVSLEPFGQEAWLLRSLPALARRVDPRRLVAEALEAHQHPGSYPATHQAVAASIACHSAVRAGQVLSAEEMEALGRALVEEANPQHCPHGRPTTLRVSTVALAREFGRTG
ncbi:MAG: DNA mismatch repair endonuclease MutL [Chloroflexota bacterium]